MALTLCLLSSILALAAPAAAQELTREEQAAFLRTARIVASRGTDKGVTRPLRLTLTDGKLTHDAQFQAVDIRKAISHTGRGRTPEIGFADSWRFNVAAHRLAVLLGIGDMVPVAVERAWQGTSGAMTWWVDDVLMDEAERQARAVEPPAREEWNRQTLRMRVFAQLAHDTDRNKGNILITNAWRLVMVDFTRAFRLREDVPAPLVTVRRCDRALLEAMRGLTKDKVQHAVGPYMSAAAVDALLARRDQLVKHFDALIARLGEAQVLY
jgi:hypothetical protein